VEFEQIVKEFTAAVEAGDGTRLAALFTDDGVYHDTFYGANQGHAAIRDMLEKRFYGDAERFKWEMRDPVCNGSIGYARWRFSYTSRMAGSEGKRAVAEGMSCFELEGGKIRRYTENFQGALALVQLDYPPERLAKLLRRWAAEQNADPALAAHLAG